MKIKNFFIMSLAALSLVACSNDEDVTPKTSNVVVNLASAALETKAMTKAEDFSSQALQSLTVEKAITSGSLYVFENDVLITKVGITGNSVSIPNLTVGNTYSFAAVVNNTATTAITKAGLKEEVIALSGKASGNFVMYGENSTNLTVQEVPEGGSNPNSVSIEVKRVLSGVQLVSIKTNFGENVPLFAKEGTAVVKSMQLLETNPTSRLDGGVIAAESGKIEGVSATLNLTFTDSETAVTVGDNNALRAYCCPGTIKYVVLNVTYTYEGTNYDRAYNITTLSNLEGGLLGNYLYGLKVTLSGAGSDAGGDPDKFESASATLSVANWSNGQIHDVPNQEN